MKRTLLYTLILFTSITFSACKSPTDKPQTTELSSQSAKEEQNDELHFRHPQLPPREPAPNGIDDGRFQRATFAGGCFWCMEKPFEGVNGVESVTSGYTGGTFEAPSYKAVSSHATDQIESIDIIFDPTKISYTELLNIYWKQINPTDNGGQFVDRGEQYRPYIWVHNPDQRQLAEASKQALQESKRFDKPIIVPIVDAVTFWPAEEYHQDFYKKDPTRYHQYRSHSGRDQFLSKYWN